MLLVFSLLTQLMTCHLYFLYITGDKLSMLSIFICYGIIINVIFYNHIVDCIAQNDIKFFRRSWPVAFLT